MFGQKPMMTSIKWEVVSDNLHTFEVNGLSFANYHHSYTGELEGGYEVVISAHSSESWRDGQKMPMRRILLKANSEGLKDLDPRCIGGASVENEYFDVELQLPRDCVRDIVSELRLHQGRVRIRIDGFEIGPTIFRITLFTLVPIDDTSVYVARPKGGDING